MIVLLRGVNVGGRKLPMASLRAELEATGCRNVATYIQSGNVVTDLPDPPPGNVQRWFEDVIAAHAGFDVPVVLRTGRELEATVSNNPYPDAGGTQLHVVFFAEAPGPAFLDTIDPQEFAPESATLVGRDLYLHLPNGMGRSDLAVAVARAGRKSKPAVVGTARNWNTVLKLLDMTRSYPPN